MERDKRKHNRVFTHPVGHGEHSKPLAAFEEEINVVNVAVICTLKSPFHSCITFLPFLSYHWEVASPSFKYHMSLISRCVKWVFWKQLLR